jgi:hypothetical protein
MIQTRLNPHRSVRQISEASAITPKKYPDISDKKDQWYLQSYGASTQK